MDDGLVVMASEVGAIDLDERRVVQKGRLRPGEMIAVDTRTGAVENDATIVARFVERQPYGQWLDENMVTLEDVRRRVWPIAPAGDESQIANCKSQTADGSLQFAICSPQMAAFGYTREELLVVLRPMWKEGREPIGSMGDDTPAAALSDVPRPLFHYFKQRFAEVTNPPIDSLREEDGNVAEPTPGLPRLAPDGIARGGAADGDREPDPDRGRSGSDPAGA